ncbi:hypothetical protein SPRG_13543 [Saprolegnia parasitica CBS 223.65]|uniref:Uncharacterized protein n=1 Tax=Saprolegnia parasitica (strain CBS 223.65) TaxID=695850 RepID=A0A067C2M3_SAPPC|nr:hypothetical protein SPRG_13543 [Saprolegnia parasitica CBS 223.65]KDO20791.1 hypothetical protein SPRG_13543 [Saprolegnia parasitica CBS 223.65]|eukprot:XP_012208529.1 hypothetical protein SPRG_13543 [Saprolegnia parasitica CBS 223.65]
MMMSLRRLAVASSRRMNVRSLTAAPTPSVASILEPEMKLPRQFIADFPEEHEGNNFEVNWSLADDDVTPRHNCYRNRALANLASVSGTFPLPIESSVALEEAHPVAFLGLWNDVTEELGHVSDLYVHDGAVGALAAVRTQIRVISDSPALAHALANLIVAVPTAKDPQTPRPILVVVQTNTKESMFAYNIDVNEDGFEQAKIVVRGNAVGLGQIQDAILKVKAQLDAEIPSNIALPCDVLTSADRASSTLVFNATAAWRSAQKDLHAAHGAIWHPEVGVTGAFEGAVVAAAAVKPSKATALKRHKTFPMALTKDLSVVRLPAATVVGHPTTAIVLAKQDKEVSVAEFVQLVNGSEALAAALEAHKTKCVTKKA